MLALKFPVRLLNRRMMVILVFVLFGSTPVLLGNELRVKVNVIIDKLPLDKQERMKDFNRIIKEYIESVDWFEETEEEIEPLEVSIQMFLTENLSNVEDRYKCEFLISSSDVQYFDRRVRFPYQKGEALVHSDQAIGPLTGILDFYINMVIASEMDKYGEYRGDFYYKRARSIAGLGKFVRTEFITGWSEREDLVRRVSKEPFLTFRKMKDYYFYGLYVRDENLAEARKNLRIALDMIVTVMEKQPNYEEPKQFLDAHFRDYIEIFKNAPGKDEVFRKLMELDADHREMYEEYISGS